MLMGPVFALITINFNMRIIWSSGACRCKPLDVQQWSVQFIDEGREDTDSLIIVLTCKCGHIDTLFQRYVFACCFKVRRVRRKKGHTNKASLYFLDV